MSHPEDQTTLTLQNPREFSVQFEQVEFDIFSHLAQLDNTSVSQLIREMAIDELRRRIRAGEIPVVKDFPADLKQAAEILAATTHEQVHGMVHEPSVKSRS